MSSEPLPAQGPVECEVRTQAADTLCWHCSKPYPMTADQCPHCCATNGNIDPASALMESANNSHIDHELDQIGAPYRAT